MTVDAAAVAAAVEGCPAVASLSAGRYGEVASYLPGARVEGVRVQGEVVEVHVVGQWGVPIPDLADQVRGATEALVDGRPVTVVVDDLAEPSSARSQEEA